MHKELMNVFRRNTKNERISLKKGRKEKQQFTLDVTRVFELVNLERNIVTKKGTKLRCGCRDDHSQL